MAKHKKIWSRESFEKYMSELPGHGVNGSHAEDSAGLAYPKSLRGAILELRHRGLDVAERQLTYLDAKHSFRESAQAWSEAAIDKAADYLASEGEVGELAVFCGVCNLEFDAVVEAYHRAYLEAGRIPPAYAFGLWGLNFTVCPAKPGEDSASIVFGVQGE